MLAYKREKFRKIEWLVGKIFSKIGLTPNQYTLASVFFALASFYFLIKLNLTSALIFFILAGLMDFIDGAVARKTNQATKKGAYLDTVVDR